jgi:hypothetical protein
MSGQGFRRISDSGWPKCEIRLGFPVDAMSREQR